MRMGAAAMTATTRTPPIYNKIFSGKTQFIIEALFQQHLNFVLYVS
jgi:hypothetical protein